MASEGGRRLVVHRRATKCYGHVGGRHWLRINFRGLGTGRLYMKCARCDRTIAWFVD